MIVISLHVPHRERPYGKSLAAMGLLALVLAAGDGVAPLVSHAREAGDYQGPCALIASEDGKTLYVACVDACQVAWMELPSGKVVRRVDVPAEPTGLTLTPDGTKLVVTCAAPTSTVAVFDAASGDLITSISAGHTAMSPTVSPDGKQLYVCNRFNNDVSVIDLAASKEVTRVPAIREPIAAAVTCDGRAVLVANHLPYTRTDAAYDGDVAAGVTVIDARTHVTTALELPHGSHSLRSLCVSPDGKHALVTHLLANFEQIPFRVDTGWINVNVVSVIDTQKMKVLSTIGLDEYDMGTGNPWDVTCTADGKWVCVSVAGTHELCVIDTAGLLSDFAHRTMQPMMAVWPIYLSLGESLWHRINLPGRGPRGLATVDSKVYVAQHFSDSIAEVDIEIEVPATRSSEAYVTRYYRDPTVEAEVSDTIGTIALGPSPQLTLERRGELLFHDATICYQQWVSCASCHPDGRGDSLNWDLMNDSVGNPKNTKSMLLSHGTPPSMAEGVRATAQVAVRSGLEHILFAERPEDEATAIDAYLTSLRPVPSPYLNNGRLSPAAERGRQLFQSERIACHRCHPAPLYTDLRSHNVGTRRRNEYKDRFDTPTLGEVWRTAPYLHDGRYLTVKELLVEGKHGLRRIRDGELSEQDIDDLVEFVLSL